MEYLTHLSKISKDGAIRTASLGRS